MYTFCACSAQGYRARAFLCNGCSKVDVEHVPAKQRPAAGDAELIMMPTAKIAKAKGSVAMAAKSGKGAMRPPEPFGQPSQPTGPPLRHVLQPSQPVGPPPRPLLQHSQPLGPPKRPLLQHSQSTGPPPRVPRPPVAPPPMAALQQPSAPERH
jgi:hypothetical protein